MLSLFQVTLALTVVTTAVEVASQVHDNGFGYLNVNNPFPLGGPLDLGDVLGLELQSFQTVAQREHFPFIPQDSLNGHDALQQNSGLQQYGNNGANNLNSAAAQVTLSKSPRGSGTTLGVSVPQSVYYQRTLPISASQQIVPTAAISQHASPIASLSAADQQSLIAAAQSAAAQSLYSSQAAAPSTIHLPNLAAFQSSQVSAPDQTSTLAQTTGVEYQNAAAQTTFPATPTPVRAPPNPQPAVGRLGSGSLGYTNLGNGLYALGSGSLGYTPPESANPPPQNLQTNTAFAGLQATLSGLHTPSQLGQGGANPLSGYGGLSLNPERLGSGNPDLNTNSVGYGYANGGESSGYGAGNAAVHGY